MRFGFKLFMIGLFLLTGIAAGAQTFESWIEYKVEDPNDDPDIPDSLWNEFVKTFMGRMATC